MSSYPHDKPLGIVLSTVTNSSLNTLISLAQQAEHYGLDSVYINEGRGDAIGTCVAVALSTSKIKIGTNIANIYFRAPYLAAHSINVLAEASEGRAKIGFGISHRDILRSIGIEMGDARPRLETYIKDVKAYLRSRQEREKGPSNLKTPLTSIFAAANTVESAKIAGKVADGIMPYLSPISSLPLLLGSAVSEAAKTSPGKSFKCVLSIPTFFCENEEDAISAAKYNLAFFANLPNYRRQWRRAGFAEDIDRIKEKYQMGASRREIARLIPMDLVEEVCVYGKSIDCRKKLEAFRAQGVDEPVLAISPVSEDRNQATLRGIAGISARQP